LIAGLLLRLLAASRFRFVGDRFPAVRILQAHRGEIGLAGAAFLGLAGILIVLMYLS
jgi:hypothetical protein